MLRNGWAIEVGKSRVKSRESRVEGQRLQSQDESIVWAGLQMQLGCYCRGERRSPEGRTPFGPTTHVRLRQWADRQLRRKRRCKRQSMSP